jgi:hypothetical protein
MVDTVAGVQNGTATRKDHQRENLARSAKAKILSWGDKIAKK